MIELDIRLPEQFLNEEIRYGYTITRQMKEVWAVELDLLNKLLEVCKKHNISVFASGGTMLGAVRHKGFIPWDDDIDMMMFREDYEKLCLVAPLEFRYPYFFQTEYSDPGSLRGPAQLRNTKTTGILKSEFNEKYKFNQGIFLDIFPLDNVDGNAVLRKKQAKRINYWKRRAYFWAKLTTRYHEENELTLKTIVKKALVKVSCNTIKKKCLEERAYQRFEKECQKYNKEKTSLVSTLSLDACEEQFYKYRSDYSELIEIPFEFMTIPIGKNYDHALRVRYGNYKEIVKGSSCHGGVIFDTQKPYNEYLK